MTPHDEDEIQTRTKLPTPEVIQEAVINVNKPGGRSLIKKHFNRSHGMTNPTKETVGGNFAGGGSGNSDGIGNHQNSPSGHYGAMDMMGG